MPGESHGQRSLKCYSPRGLKESDTSEPLSLPLHGMIFKSKLTVIIKFSLNIKKNNFSDTTVQPQGVKECGIPRSKLAGSAKESLVAGNRASVTGI